MIIHEDGVMGGGGGPGAWDDVEAPYRSKTDGPQVSARGWTASAAGIAGRGAPMNPLAGAVEETGNLGMYGWDPYRDCEGAFDATSFVVNNITDNICPSSADAQTAVGPSGTIAAFSEMLGKGMQVIWTHGDIFFKNKNKNGKIVMPYALNTKAGSLMLATAEKATPQSVQAKQAQLASGHIGGMIVDDPDFKCPKPPVVAFGVLPGLVAAHGKLPQSIVSMSACRSAEYSLMADTFVKAGARFVYGFTKKVSPQYADAAAVTFWGKLMNRKTTGEAFAEVSKAPDAKGALPKQFGSPNVVIKTSAPKNSGFEDGKDHWKKTGNGEFEVVTQIDGVGSAIKAAEGAKFAYATIVAPKWTYTEFETPICPVEGQVVKVTFKWQVVVKFAVSCSSSSPGQFNMRLDADTGNNVLWSNDWKKLCPQLKPLPNSGFSATGWQTHSVTFTTPKANPETLALSWHVNGYVWEQLYGLVDDVKLEISK